MKVLLANPRGFCAGVDRAVKIVDLALDVFGPPVYVRREIVHNSHVVGALRGKGAVFVEELDEVPDGALAVFSAHGVAPSVFEQGERRGLRVIDATCPLVTKVHLEVHRFIKQGYHIVLIGHTGHDEVVGTIGQAPEQITLVESVEAARTVELSEHDKLMVLTQTTLSMDDTSAILEALRERFPLLELPPTDDICYATQNRQDAVKAMVEAGMDVLLVVGSRNSSNAKRLVETSELRGRPGHLIDGPEEIQPAWLDGAEVVGVTAGASTPETVVQAVVARLRELGAGAVELFNTAEEDTVFSLPVILKDALADQKGAPGATRAAEPR